MSVGRGTLETSCRGLKYSFGFLFEIYRKSSCPFSNFKNRNTLIFLVFRFFFEDLFGGLGVLNICGVDMISVDF